MTHFSPGTLADVFTREEQACPCTCHPSPSLRAALTTTRGSVRAAALLLGWPVTTTHDRLRADAELAAWHRATFPPRKAAEPSSPAYVVRGDPGRAVVSVEAVDWTGSEVAPGLTGAIGYGPDTYCAHPLRLLVARRRVTVRLYLPAGVEPTAGHREALRVALAGASEKSTGV